MANTGYREKKEGPVRLIYQGERHIGNIIDPIFGAAKIKTQGYTAISKHWGRKTTHDSKHAAMTWLTGRHGATMRIENTGDNGSTFDVLRDNGWKKTQPYGFRHHFAAHTQGATYVHPDLPGHHITASYTNDTWQHHHGGAKANVGLGAKSLHNHLTKVHSSKTIEGIKEYVAWAQEEYPDNWQEAVIELMHRPLNEDGRLGNHLGHGWSLHSHNPGRNEKWHDVFKNPMHSRHQIAHNDTGQWTHTGKHAKIEGQGHGWNSLRDHLDKFHSTNEEPILGATPHSTMQRSVKASKVSVVKRDPEKAVTLPPSVNTIGEEDSTKETRAKIHQRGTDFHVISPKHGHISTHKTRLEAQRAKDKHNGKLFVRLTKLKTNEDNNSGDGQSGGISNSDMPHDRDIIDKDPKNQKNKGKVPGKKSKGLDTVMKYANKANIRNADDSIPKVVDTKPAFNTGKDNTGTDSTGEKQGPHPVPSSDAEGELTIKRTMTGEPGDTIEINPLMKRTGAYGGTNYNPSPEGKKTPNT